MIKDCLSIVFPYLDWASDQRYLVLTNSPEYRSEGTSRCQYIKKVWKKYTLFEKKHIKYGGWHHYVNGKRHQDDDLPTIEWNNGDKQWYKNGKLHRRNGLPAIEYKELKEWYKNGECHRDEDLPAVEREYGGKEWWRNGKLHRDNDQPAIKHYNGDKEWWVDGVFIKSDFARN